MAVTSPRGVLGWVAARLRGLAAWIDPPLPLEDRLVRSSVGSPPKHWLSHIQKAGVTPQWEEGGALGPRLQKVAPAGARAAAHSMAPVAPPGPTRSGWRRVLTSHRNAVTRAVRTTLAKTEEQAGVDVGVERTASAPPDPAAGARAPFGATPRRRNAAGVLPTRAQRFEADGASTPNWTAVRQPPEPSSPVWSQVLAPRDDRGVQAVGVSARSKAQAKSESPLGPVVRKASGQLGSGPGPTEIEAPNEGWPTLDHAFMAPRGGYASFQEHVPQGPRREPAAGMAAHWPDVSDRWPELPSAPDQEVSQVARIEDVVELLARLEREQGRTKWSG